MVKSKFVVAPYPLVPGTPVLPDTVLYTGGEIKKMALKEKIKNITFWCIVCAVTCVPVTILIDELVAFFHPSLAFYNQPDSIEWLWLGILYVVCFIGIAAAVFTSRLSEKIAD